MCDCQKLLYSCNSPNSTHCKSVVLIVVVLVAIVEVLVPRVGAVELGRAPITPDIEIMLCIRVYKPLKALLLEEVLAL